jgi:hypothetical protein
MRKMIFLALLLSSLASLSPLALIGRACQRVSPISVDDICLKADVVVRASAFEYVKAPEGDIRQLDVPSGVSIRFRVNEIVKGQDVPQELVINGYLTDFDDFNDRPVPYDFVRPGGRHGNCTAYEYKRGAEFLLFLKKSEGKLTPYWDALSPTNEQLHSKTDPWISWVKERLKTLEGEKSKNKISMFSTELLKIAFKWWLGLQSVA